MKKISLKKSFLLLAFLVYYVCSIGENCGINICSSRGAICLNGSCLCKECYFTLPNSHLLCDYHQSSSIMATILEFFFPIGFGHFYLGNYLMGCIKMITVYFLLCGYYIVAIYCFAAKRNRVLNSQIESNNNNLNTLSLLRDNIGDAAFDMIKIKHLGFLMQKLFVYVQVLDLIFLFNAFYKDGKGITLC